MPAGAGMHRVSSSEEEKNGDKAMKKLMVALMLIMAVGLMGWMVPAEKTPIVLSEQWEAPEPTPEPEAPRAPVEFVPLSTTMEYWAQMLAPERPVIPELATDYEVELIARTIWGEAGGIPADEERSAVAWCILNRVDAWGESIEEVVTAEGQFHGYIDWGTCPAEHIELAEDVVGRWEREHAGEDNVGRVLPAGYMWFYGDGQHNHFRNSFNGGAGWDWSLESPY